MTELELKDIIARLGDDIFTTFEANNIEMPFLKGKALKAILIELNEFGEMETRKPSNEDLIKELYDRLEKECNYVGKYDPFHGDEEVDPDDPYADYNESYTVDEYYVFDDFMVNITTNALDE